jgi:hypothetical protein
MSREKILVVSSEWSGEGDYRMAFPHIFMNEIRKWQTNNSSRTILPHDVTFQYAGQSCIVLTPEK